MRVTVRADGAPECLIVGPHELSVEAIESPVAVCITPGSPTPLYRLWLPLLVEGCIDDPSGSIRIVHEGDEAVLSNGPPV